MRGYLCACAFSALVAGCVVTGQEPDSSSAQARAEVRADTAALAAAGITRVSVASDGAIADLSLNPATGTYDGTLILASGTHSVVATAFAGDQLIGRSQPVPVGIAAGVVTRVEVRVLDLRPGAAPVFGPIVDSLAFPTTANAGDASTFAVTAVAPAGDPLTYAWTADCPDSTFSATDAATTTWAKPAQGACIISVAVTSNGFTVRRSFGIVVFPAGASTGAVDVSSTFVTAPTVVWSFAPGLAPVDPQNSSCTVVTGNNASCQFTVASPDVVAYQASVVDWGASTPGTLEVSDSCGGRFGTSNQGSADRSGFWLPPVAGGLCILTVSATNRDGLTGTVVAAILADAGAAPSPTQPPTLSVLLDVILSQTMQANIRLDNPAPPPTTLALGLEMLATGFVGWRDGLPGSVTVVDSCVGPQPTTVLFFQFTQISTPFWTIPSTPGTLCTVTVQATNLQGATNDVSAQYRIGAP